MEGSKSFVHGWPGLTPFSVRAIVRVVNNTNGKYKNLWKVVVDLRGGTFVDFVSFCFIYCCLWKKFFLSIWMLGRLVRKSLLR